MSERFTGIVATLFLDKKLVASWLPEGLALADSPYADHPVIVLYGTQRGLARHKRFTIYPRFGREAFGAFFIDCRITKTPRDRR